MIDKHRIENIHGDLIKALKVFADQHNLSVSPFNMSYSPTGFKFSVQMGDKTELGDADPVLAKNTKTYGDWYKLTVEDIGKTFTFNAVPVVFEGLKNKTTAIYHTMNGKRYRADANRFAIANGRKVLDINHGKALGTW